MCVIICGVYYILIIKNGFPPFLVKFSLILITSLTCMAIFSPAFSFIFAMIISTSLFFFTIPYEIYNGFHKAQQNYLHQTLIFFSKTQILDLLAWIYIYFFCVPKKNLIIRFSCISIIIIGYFFTSRYYFYHRVILLDPHTGSYFIYLMFFLGIFTLYIRLLLNIALFTTLTTLRLDPSLLSPNILYTLGDDQDPGSQLPQEPQKGGRPFFSFIDRSKNTYHQNFNPHMHGRFSRGINLAIGFCGLCIGGATLYYAQIQSEHAINNTLELKRQNDLEEVSQGFMSAEDYAKKYNKVYHPENKHAD